MSLLRAQLPESAESSYFLPGQNCWKIAHSHRLSLLIDAEAYYGALVSAIQQARESVIVLAWDIDTRVDLKPNAYADGNDTQLGRVIQRALGNNPGLQIRILCWDFSVIYLFERQLFAPLQNVYRHPRIRFAYDGKHPFGASQHQKLVIIDDHLAFIGGLDLCQHRWDTREHRTDDPRRRDHAEKPYDPFHDIQAVLDGEAARNLAQLARERWKKATGEIVPPARVLGRPWPEGVSPDFEDLSLAISRTAWSDGISPHVREVEAMLLDSIRRARRHVYIENQYLTAESIGDAIAERLGDPNGPEFLILIPRYNSGWIEDSTMGILRLRLLERLKEADIHQRLRIYFPEVGVNECIPVSLHSKIMIVDGEVLHTGSANLSNRSLGFDTECDITVGAFGDDRRARSIRRLRDSLIAEHLGADEQEVSRRIEETDSLFAAVDRFNDRPESAHRLARFELPLHPLLDWVTPESSVLDPATPAERTALYSRFIPKDRELFLETKARKLKARILLSLLATFVLAYALPAQGVDPRTWLAPGTDLSDANAIAVTLGFILLGSAVAIPADILVFASCIAMGAFEGSALSLLGLVFASCVFYGVGRIRAYQSRTRTKTSRPHLGIWLQFLLNANLIREFRSVAFASGALRAPFPQFAIGTFLGQIPRIAAIALYSATLQYSLLNPSATALLLCAVTGASLLFLSRVASQRILPL